MHKTVTNAGNSNTCENGTKCKHRTALRKYVANNFGFDIMYGRHF